LVRFGHWSFSLGLNRLVIQIWHLPFHEVVGAEASFLDMHPGKKFKYKIQVVISFVRRERTS
jgi:hypothetical protein